MSEFPSLAAQDYPVDEKVKKKLQRVDIEQDHEKHRAGQESHEAVLQSEAPAVDIMMIPDHRQKSEADAERYKSAHRFH
jgi:hypothetical protein